MASPPTPPAQHKAKKARLEHTLEQVRADRLRGEKLSSYAFACFGLSLDKALVDTSVNKFHGEKDPLFGGNIVGHADVTMDTDITTARACSALTSALLDRARKSGTHIPSANDGSVGLVSCPLCGVWRAIQSASCVDKIEAMLGKHTNAPLCASLTNGISRCAPKTRADRTVLMNLVDTDPMNQSFTIAQDNDSVSVGIVTAVWAPKDAVVCMANVYEVCWFSRQRVGGDVTVTTDLFGLHALQSVSLGPRRATTTAMKVITALAPDSVTSSAEANTGAGAGAGAGADAGAPTRAQKPASTLPPPKATAGQKRKKLVYSKARNSMHPSE